MSKRDYYEVLGLAKNSSDDEIKRAYRQLASKYHPDKISGDDGSPEKKQAEEKFKEVGEAYETLSTPDKRHQYDMHGHVDTNSFGGGQHQWAHHSTGNPAHFEEMFKSIFSQNSQFSEGLFGRQQPKQQIVHVVTISLADAYVGKAIKVDGTTTLTIPRGARSGTKFFANNKLYRVDIQQHYKFKRANDDLLVDIAITAIEAMIGIEAMLDHLDNNKLQFSIPAGIQPGQIVKLSGKGMRNPETDRTGDILVRISIVIPKGLSNESIVELKALKTLDHREVINI